MCGIGGFLRREAAPDLVAEKALDRINALQAHRGPDGHGKWSSGIVGLAHRRLSILDLDQGAQPMASDATGNVITFNGEIYNFLELREELGADNFRTRSDTEVILKAYERWGVHCVERLRGMFAFALWDARKEALFVARDRFGIKPFYFVERPGSFVFASEMKALLPFLDGIETCPDALSEYFTFQFCLGERTLFKGIRQLPPAHAGYIHRDGKIELRQYWEVHYELDWDHTQRYFVEKVRETIKDSIDVHLRSDVPVGAYVSGGIDSSLVALLARDLRTEAPFSIFNGRFLEPGYDESEYAAAVAKRGSMQLEVGSFTEADFVEGVGKLLYHLDQPVAGPGSFPQYFVSALARQHVKVVLGGQGGDEIFGGYVRYLIAYFEQCVKGAIDGTHKSGNFLVTYESIIPNLVTLRQYKPLLQEFWASGIFDERDKRYFRLVNRANTFGGAIRPGVIRPEATFEAFRQTYWGKNVGKEAYFDSMTHFDFKTLLPALLHVEDRVSMAHGLESRVPLIDHEVVELAATIPADIKFQGGELKHLLRQAFADTLPAEILSRKDKMGFPVPMADWMRNGKLLPSFLRDTFGSQRARGREYLSETFDIDSLFTSGSPFNRNVWALLSLELWQQAFHDKSREWTQCEF
jgi:asparagine synthase (glutamine-hydrolysing)